MARNAFAPPDPDKIIHERARLRILVFLASSEAAEARFTELRSSLGMTAGNLSAQLSTLDEAGYIEIRKGFSGRKPFTNVALTHSGRGALDRYLDEMEGILSSLKSMQR